MSVNAPITIKGVVPTTKHKTTIPIIIGTKITQILVPNFLNKALVPISEIKKPTTCIIGHEDNIVYPASSQQVDYEGELGVVIGKRTRQVSVEAAEQYILGYTCFNDVTARDLQYKDKQWTRSKGFDTFAPIGPCIETELDPGHLDLETRLNGEIRQSTNTSDLIFTVPELVSFISHVMTLLPGDVIATGTTSGIGPMQPGDTVEVRIEGIGTLRNYVV